MNRVGTVVLAFAFVVIVFLGSDSFAQCAMCKASVESNNLDGGNSAEGLNNGILYLMSIPYILFSIIGYFWYKNSRKNAKNPLTRRRYTGKMPSMQTGQNF